MATKSTFRLAPAASFFSASPAAAFTSAQITVAPWRANAMTVALPMPEAPPVTNATLPSNIIALLLILFAQDLVRKPARLSGSCAAFHAFLCRFGIAGAPERNSNALARLRIGEQLPGHFEFVGVAAAAGSEAATMQALLAASAAAGRSAMRLAISAARCGQLGARQPPNAPRRAGGRRAVEHFGAENQARGERRDRTAASAAACRRRRGSDRAALPAGRAWLRWRRCAGRTPAPVQTRRPWPRRRFRPSVTCGKRSMRK